MYSGNNFGFLQHDTGPTCAPYGTNESDANDGNYIMFGEATSGDWPHNDLFSECSRDNITRVLTAVLTGDYGKFNCLTS